MAGMSTEDQEAAPHVWCVIDSCLCRIDPAHHEAQICGQCSEYVCPRHQRTVDGDTWCSECDSEMRAEQARERKGSAPIPGPEGKAGSLTYPGLAATAETTGADVLSIGPGGSSPEVDDG